MQLEAPVFTETVVLPFVHGFVVGYAIAKAEHGVHTMTHGFAGMQREAPEAARRAQPALTKVVDDIADIKANLKPAIDRPVTVRG